MQKSLCRSKTAEGFFCLKQIFRQTDILFGDFFPRKIGGEAFRRAGGRFLLQAVGVGQLADDLRRRIAGAEVLKALVTVPLGEPPPVRGQQQRAVGKAGGL